MLNLKSHGKIPSTLYNQKVVDRIGSGYTPTSAGLHSDRAFELSAGLGFNGAMPYKSGKAARRQQKSLKLSQNSELKRAAESMQRALGRGKVCGILFIWRSATRAW